MDSLSQIALGSAVAMATIGRRTALWKAALWGAVAGTLPDLDAFIDHGDPVSNMTLHRTESHALFYLTLAAPLLAAAAAGLHGERALFRRWWLALWLALVTHPLLDLMTVYGTQLGLPFTDHPYGVGSIFIIDPLYTLPLLVGTGMALARDGRGALRCNAAGLLLSTLYLAWSVVAQQLATRAAEAALRAQGRQVERLLVTPTPFNTLLWRIVAITPQGYAEGFHSLLDEGGGVAFDDFPRGQALLAPLQGNPAVARIAWFSHGFFKLAESQGGVFVTDLRMGQEPVYIFSFRVARRDGARLLPLVPESAGGRPEVGRSLAWLWRRALGEPLAPPR
ncbi:MAG TPA: metal-dependent hydrolase [Ideonella sp.]|nr:metal-dependent hydrolase [Ideonella sp.]